MFYVLGAKFRVMKPVIASSAEGHKDGAIHTSCYHMLHVSHWFHKICSESLLLHKNSRICKHIQKGTAIIEETKTLSFEYTRIPFFFLQMLEK